MPYTTPRGRVSAARMSGIPRRRRALTGPHRSTMARLRTRGVTVAATRRLAKASPRASPLGRLPISGDSHGTAGSGGRAPAGCRSARRRVAPRRARSGTGSRSRRPATRTSSSTRARAGSSSARRGSCSATPRTSAPPRSTRGWSSSTPTTAPSSSRGCSGSTTGRSPTHRIEYRMRAKDGSWRAVLVSTRALARDPDGVPIRTAGTITDVSDARALRERVAHADRLSSLGALASGVAHAVNNPLASVASGLRVLQEELERCGEAPGEARRPLPELRQAVGRRGAGGRARPRGRARRSSSSRRPARARAREPVDVRAELGGGDRPHAERDRAARPALGGPRPGAAARRRRCRASSARRS